MKKLKYSAQWIAEIINAFLRAFQPMGDSVEVLNFP